MTATHTPPGPLPSTPGQDVLDAAQDLVDRALDDVLGMDEIERYDRLIWHRQVLLVAAQQLTVESGYPLAWLARQGLSHRQIAALLAEREITLSAARVGDLVGPILRDQ